MAEYIFLLRQYTEPYQFAENSLWEYTVAFAVFVVSFILLRFFRLILLKRLVRVAANTENRFDNIVINALSQLRARFYTAFSLYIALFQLSLPYWLEKTEQVFLIVIMFAECIRSLTKLFEHISGLYLENIIDEKDRIHAKSMLRMLRGAVVFVLWLSLLLLLLANLGVDITSLIASLGIGGIAVALALQNVLSDVFSSFSIFIDKPFQVGDYIVIGDHAGVVKQIGLKTTRLQTLRGEVLVIPNKELTAAKIQNFRSLTRRRDTVVLALEYGTSVSQMTKLEADIKALVEEIDGLSFESCYLRELGDWSVNVELVYYIESDKYQMYLSKRQALLFAIIELFEAKGLSFPFPTSTLIAQK